MTFTIVRVAAPDEEPVENPFLYEAEAVARARELEADLPDWAYHEVRDQSGRAVWTSEGGELVRFRGRSAGRWSRVWRAIRRWGRPRR